MWSDGLEWWLDLLMACLDDCTLAGSIDPVAQASHELQTAAAFTHLWLTLAKRNSLLSAPARMQSAT